MKRTYHVLDMECANCVEVIEEIGDELPGVQLLMADFYSSTLELEFDERKISEAQILAAVEERGYHLQVLQ